MGLEYSVLHCAFRVTEEYEHRLELMVVAYLLSGCIPQIITALELDEEMVNITVLSLSNGSIVAELSIEVFGDTHEEVADTVQTVSDADFTSLDVENELYRVAPLEIIGKISAII